MLSNRVESWTDQWKREGLEQGRQETRHLLARQARHRFGPAVATQAEPLLTAIADPVQLADLGDALLSCPDGTAWLPPCIRRSPCQSPATSTHNRVRGLPGPHFTLEAV